jgi:hypothetical protein
MNKSFPVLLAPLAALLLAGSALAQTSASRVDHACTTSTLSTDPAAPCTDDVLNDRRDNSAATYRAPTPAAAGSGSMGTGTTYQPGVGGTGPASTGAAGNIGAGSAGTSMGTTGTGAMPTSGTAGTPARQ